MSSKRTIAAVTGGGRIVPIQQDTPPVKPGTVLVEVHASLVSPGTELGGWRQLARQLADPELLAAPRPFGYANAGVVREAGEGVDELAVGDRVACMGAGYAQHTDLAVMPHNLCVKIPENVTFAQGAYAHLAATALMALRRGRPEFGESVGIVGLGIVGQLAAQLYRLAGNFVIGWDTISTRTGVAEACGIDATVLVGSADEVAATRAFTGGYGLDAAVIAFGGDANKAVESVHKSLKVTPDGHVTGRIVVVGGAFFTCKAQTTNVDIRRSSRTGPGYHDDPWEVGPDYPPVFMRWTTRTNLKLCIRLMSEGRLNVDALTTHTIALTDVEAGVAAALKDPDSILGVVFEMVH